MRIQLISKENGLGLSHDMQVLRSALVGISGASMQVTSTDWQAKPSAPGTFDVNIFLELLNPAHYRSGKAEHPGARTQNGSCGNGAST
jgi:hypothetical protein